MDLIADLPDLNLYNPEVEVRTTYYNAQFAKLGPHAKVARSLVANGVIVKGCTESTILLP